MDIYEREREIWIEIDRTNVMNRERKRCLHVSKCSSVDKLSLSFFSVKDWAMI